MADISKINGVEIGNISKLDGVEKDNINTFHSGEVPASQADPANVDMTSGDNDHPFGADYQSFGNVACTAVVGGTTYVAVCGSDNANSRYPTVRVGTWNGSAVTWGDKVTIHTDGEVMGHGLVWDEDNERFIGTMFDYGNNTNNYNDITVFGASLTTSGSGSPKIANINLSNMYRPYDDNNGDNYNQYVHGNNAIIYDRGANRAVVFWEKGGPSSGSSKGGDPDDIVGAVLSFTDVSSNNAITTSDFTVIHDDPSNARSYFTYDSNVNRIINVSQGFSSGDFKVKAGTITGTGATLTVNSTTSYSKNSIVNSNIGNSDSSISLAANYVSYQNNPIVFDTQNNVTHVMLWDDDVDDFVLTNFTTGSDNSITWAVSNGQPIRSNGLATQYSGDITQGKTSGWDKVSQPYFTTNIGFDPQFKRIVISGSDSVSASGAKQQGAAVAYSSTTGYHFIGTLIQMLTNAQGGGGWKMESVGDKIGYSNTFNGGAMFYHYRQNNGTGYGSTLYGMTAGAGQRTASAGIFSAGNSVLPAAATRLTGIGLSRFASMAVGGAGASNSWNGSSYPDVLTTTTEYNGSAVISGGNMNVARFSPSGSGSITAGLMVGGTGTAGHGAGTASVNSAEEYNGTSWSNASDTTSAVGGDNPGGCGSQTNSLFAGGYINAYHDSVESYDGTNFANEADYPTNIYVVAAAGSSKDDNIFFGGYVSSRVNTNYSYNSAGSGAWTTLNSLSAANSSFMSSGTSTDCVLTGGADLGNDDGEIWNGTSWAASATNGLGTLDKYAGSRTVNAGGTSNAVFFGGGSAGNYSDATNTICHHDR